jgi:hypothetical protein
MTEPSAQAHADPWDAVLAYLTAPAGERPIPLPRAPGDTRPTPMIGRGHPFTALPGTIRCRKHRAIAHRRLYAVTFDSEQPFPAHWWWLIAAEEQEDGWVARRGAGGAGDGPSRSDPWVNLAGWWGHDRFYAGGEILAGENVTAVRLNSRDGEVLEDDTAAGVVLFLAARALELPVTLELLDAHGQLVASQLELDMPR